MQDCTSNEPLLPLDLPECVVDDVLDSGVGGDMASEIIPPARFDYSQYDAAVASEIRNAAIRIRSRGKAQTAAIAETGGTLLAVKEKVGQGMVPGSATALLIGSPT